MIIAIDGPAASGKGTLGRRIAKTFGFHYLDTGLLYRALAYDMMTRDEDLEDEELGAMAAQNLDVTRFDDSDLRKPGVGGAASIVAKNIAARAALLDFQRAFAKKPPGAVLDGRDIGTVVCPDAPVKIFVTATPKERAKRRHMELVLKDPEISFEDVLRDIELRDERDRDRKVAPLSIALDAHLLETTNLDIETALNAALAIIRDINGQ